MSWRAAWKLSDVAFAELAFQAIYAVRMGAALPAGPSSELVPRAQRRVAQSKAVIGAVLGLLTIGAGALLRSNPTGVSHLFPQAVSPTLWVVGILMALFGLDTAFLWWNGLQVLPTLLASSVLTALEPLPIAPTTLRRTAALVYLRLFDVPALVILILTPLAVGVALGPLAGLATIPGALMAVLFALALALATGRFFVRRIQGARGGGGRTLVRWFYLLLWLVPAFAVLGLVAVGAQFFTTLALIANAGSPLAGELLVASYPFSVAFLPALAAQGPLHGSPIPLRIAVVLGEALAVYTALAVWSAVWMFRSVYRLGTTPPAPPEAGPAARYDLHPRSPAFAVIQKDLRIASRTPAYAFLLLLPIFDAFGLGIVTILDAPGRLAAQSLAGAAVTAAALLATFFGPAFFAIEVLAHSYGRSLPLSDRSILVGKVGLIGFVYVASAGVVLGLTAIRVFDPALFLAFALAELPAVLAAGLFELGWLFRKARRGGFPIANLYAGAWTALAAAVPGLVAAGLPLAVNRFLGIPGMAAVAVVELAIAIGYATGVSGT